MLSNRVALAASFPRDDKPCVVACLQHGTSSLLQILKYICHVATGSSNQYTSALSFSWHRPLYTDSSLPRVQTSHLLHPIDRTAHVLARMSSSQSRIAEIAATIAQHTQRVDEYLSKNSLPYPSFDASGPVDLGLPSELEESRNIVLRATQELNDLLHSPKELIFNHHVSFDSTRMIQV